MSTPCAIFWDLLNSSTPDGVSAESLVIQIRSTVIKAKGLEEIYFFCVCDVRVLPDHLVTALTFLGVQIVYADNDRNSIDDLVTDLIRKFVQIASIGCAIILLSGEGDYSATLLELEKLNDIAIYLVELTKPFSIKFEALPYLKFKFMDGQLNACEPFTKASKNVCIENISDGEVRNDKMVSEKVSSIESNIDKQIIPIFSDIKKSFILCGNCVYFNFNDPLDAAKSIPSLYKYRADGKLLKTDLIPGSPLAEILKCLDTDESGGGKKKKSDETKRLMFININKTDDVSYDKNLMEFCLAVSTSFGSQCMLLNKSSIWIVFDYLSKAEICLPKLKILCTDATIKNPPGDLLSPESAELYSIKINKPKLSTDETFKHCELSRMNEELIDQSIVANTFEPTKKREVKKSKRQLMDKRLSLPKIEPVVEYENNLQNDNDQRWHRYLHQNIDIQLFDSNPSLDDELNIPLASLWYIRVSIIATLRPKMLNRIVSNLKGQQIDPENIMKNAISFSKSLCIGFPSSLAAVESVRLLNGFRYQQSTLESELIPKSPLLVMLRCLLTDEFKDEHKHLTFIKIDYAGDIIYDEKLMDFCIAVATNLGSLCILSKKSSIWVVFPYRSHAKSFLEGAKTVYDDAIISEPPEGLLSYCPDDPFTIKVCKFRVPKSGIFNSSEPAEQIRESSETQPEKGCNNSDLTDQTLSKPYKSNKKCKIKKAKSKLEIDKHSLTKIEPADEYQDSSQDVNVKRSYQQMPCENSKESVNKQNLSQNTHKATGVKVFDSVAALLQDKNNGKLHDSQSMGLVNSTIQYFDPKKKIKVE